MEKTRTVVIERLNTPPVTAQSPQSAELQNDLNEALGKIAALESQLLKLKQEGLRSVNSNQYLDETNARLRRQLQQLKADEKELEVRNQELPWKTKNLNNLRTTLMPPKKVALKLETLNYSIQH